MSDDDAPSIWNRHRPKRAKRQPATARKTTHQLPKKEPETQASLVAKMILARGPATIYWLGQGLLSNVLSFLTPNERLECRRVSKYMQGAAQRSEIWRMDVARLWSQGMLAPRFTRYEPWYRWVLATLHYPYQDAAYSLRAVWQQCLAGFDASPQIPSYEAWRLMLIGVCTYNLYVTNARGTTSFWQRDSNMTDLLSVCRMHVERVKHENHSHSPWRVHIYNDVDTHRIATIGSLMERGCDRVYIQLNLDGASKRVWNGLDEEWERNVIMEYCYYMRLGQSGPWATAPLVQETHRWWYPDYVIYSAEFAASTAWFTDND